LAGISLTPAFVGRTRELAELTQALEASTTGTGRGQLVLLAGEPGIGKTRLTEELATIARQRATTVLVGRCWEGDGAPAFWPWVQITRAYLQHGDPETLAANLGAGAPAIAQVIPEVRERLPHLPALSEIEPAQARFRFFDSFTLLLKRMATTRPILLVLDDLHWADTPSLLLLQFLARELTDTRVLVVGTYRDTEVDRTHPLSEVLGALARESQRIALAGLSVEEVAQLIAGATGTPFSASLSHTVHAQTEGNPFFVSELLRLLEAEGRLTTPTASTGARGRVPQAVRETTRRRVARLSTPCQQVLTAAAVIGREFGSELLVKVVTDSDSLDRAASLLALQDAMTARLIHAVEEERGRYRFVHALVRETLYEDLSLVDRVDLHRRVGEAVETLYAGYLRPYFAELADHFCKAALGGTAIKAVQYAVNAAERATALLAYEEAIAHYERALRTLALTESTEAQRCELLLALGDAQRKAGNARQARESFQRAAAIARKQGLPTHLARAALGFGEVWIMTGVGVVDAPLVGLLNEALSALGQEDSVLRAQALARLAVELRWSDGHERRTVLSQQAVEMARRLGDKATLVYVLNAWHWVLWGPENVEERLVAASEIVRLSEETENKAMALAGHKWRIAALLELGDIAAVDREITVVTRLAEELRQPFYRWWAKVLQVMRALLEGRLAEAEHLAQQALVLGQQVQAPDAVQAFGAHMASLRHEEGRFQELEGAIKAFVEQHPTVPAWRGVLAYLYYESGHQAEARREFDRLMANGLTDLSHDQQWVTTVVLLAEVCVFLGDRRSAALLYDCLHPYAERNVVVGPATACYGSAGRYLGLLATTMGRWEEATRHFEAALEMNARMGTQLYVAWTQYDYACMFLTRGQSGDKEQAVTFLDQALATARELGMVRLEEKIQRLGVRGWGLGEEGKVQNDTAPMLERPVPSLYSPAPSTQHPTPHTFRHEGDNWMVSYESLTVRLRNAKGFRHLATLLREPGREFHVVDLLAETDHEPATVHPQQLAQDVSVSILATSSALPDHQARASYRQRLADLRDQLAEAERFNDTGRIAILRSESEFLTQELSTRYGISQHARKSSTEVEKARKAVAYRIRSALTKLKKAHPILWRHLHLTIKTGVFCSYNPEKPISWRI